MPDFTRLTTAIAVLALPFTLVVPEPVQAQDFLFGRPDVTLTVSAGWASPGEQSDIFGYTRDELELERGAFAAPAGMAELAWRVSERLDVGLGLEHASRTVATEMSDWVTVDEAPIPRSVTFSRTRLSATARGYLLPVGRTLSEYSWVANRWSPYLGGGVGATGYQFVHEGDFVHEETLDIFEDRLVSEGRALTAHALAGLQVSLTPRLVIRGEYQYVWGDADVGRNPAGSYDFQGFEAVDLSGWRAMLGLGIRM